MLYITPRQGITLRRLSDRRVIPTTGAWVPDNQYWRRRLRDGDAVETPPQEGAAVSPEDATPAVETPEEG